MLLGEACWYLGVCSVFVLLAHRGHQEHHARERVRGLWFMVSHLSDYWATVLTFFRYFCSRKQMPQHPTLGAFKRAMTYSFGSICFGSLIVSVVQLLKQIASIAQQSEATDGNFLACFLWAVANCILGIVLWLIEYFNVRASLVHRQLLH